MLSRRTILLKPMQPALSGYARLQSDGSSMLVQVHVRGLEKGQSVRLYWYLNDQHAQEIAKANANAHGEASFEADETESATRLHALILISADESPKPLLIGLCSQQASLMDVKNAALALCERLVSLRRPAVQPVAAPVAPPEPPKTQNDLPREVFLPAIDPAPYAQAVPAAQMDAPQKAIQPPPARAAPPVDRLRPLKWPRGFESLKPYFENALPTAPFDLPGWRFVYAAHAGGPNGLWIGMRAQDGRVCGVAYAHRGDKPPAGQHGYRVISGLDGLQYQILIQQV